MISSSRRDNHGWGDEAISPPWLVLNVSLLLDGEFFGFYRYHLPGDYHSPSAVKSRSSPDCNDKSSKPIDIPVIV